MKVSLINNIEKEQIFLDRDDLEQTLRNNSDSKFSLENEYSGKRTLYVSRRDSDSGKIYAFLFNDNFFESMWIDNPSKIAMWILDFENSDVINTTSHSYVILNLNLSVEKA